MFTGTTLTVFSNLLPSIVIEGVKRIMGSVYKKIFGQYGKQNYDVKYLENAVKAVKKGRMTLRRASAMFGTPYTTLQRHVTNPTLKKNGG